MVSDRNDNTPDVDDDDENGVLTDTGSIDTTSIGIFGSTAHMSVSMPVGSEEDELDDDALVDDIVADELAVDELHVEPVAAVDAAAIAEGGEAAEPETASVEDSPIEPEALEAEIVEDVVEAEIVDEDAEPVAADALVEEEPLDDSSAEDSPAEGDPVDDEFDVDEPVVDADGDGHSVEEQPAAASADADADDEDGDVEGLDDEPVVDLAATHETAEDDADDAVEFEDIDLDDLDAVVIEDDEPVVDPYAAFAAAGFTVDGVAPTDEDDEPATAGSLDADAVVVEDDSDEAGDVGGGSADTEEPAADESDAEDIVDGIIVEDLEDGEFETDDEGTAVDEVKPITDPLTRSALRQAMNDTDHDGGEERVSETDRVHETERIAVQRQEVALTSKRVGEFEPNRESADLLTADRLLDHSKVGRTEPEGAWQQFVYSVSGKRINLGDSKRARARKELDHRIATPLAGGARFIPVLSRKGGVGKTTVTALLGMALADARDDRVIAVDANPDRGTLAERISRPSGRTVRDLARLRGQVTGYNDISTIVARDETRLDVISSDADPHVSEAFSDHDYRDVASVAAHYYSLVLTDTGTGIVHSVMGATLDMADELVIVAGLSVDEARLASETLTWLETNGFADKVRRAVVVLNNQRPGSPLVLPSELEAHFRSRVRAVVRMPYDPHIAAGSAITYRELQPATREAARELAAIVVEGLRQLDQAA